MINSNLDRISDRVRAMASFPLKNAHSSYPGITVYSTSNLKMILLHLYRYNFACLSSTHMVKYLYEKFLRPKS